MSVPARSLRLIAGLGALTLTSGLLVACGSPGESEKVIHLAGIIEPTIDEGSRERYQWIAGAIEQFEKENPGFRVEYKFHGSGGGGNIATDILRGLKTGVQTDVTMVESTRIAEYSAENALLDLHESFATWSEETRADLEWLSNISYFSGSEEFLSVPAIMHARAIAYRKDLFEKAGIDPSNPPETLEELVDIAKQLTGDGVYGLGMYFGNHAATTEVYFAPYMWDRGTDLVDENGKAIFASEDGVAVAEWLSGLVNEAKVTPQSAVSGDYVDSITGGYFSGQFAMAEGFGNYMLADLAKTEYADKTGFFLPPLEQRLLNYWGLGVVSNTPYPAESARLIEIMMQPEHLDHFDYGLPVRESAYDNPIYQSEAYEVMRKAAATGNTGSKTVHYQLLCDTVAAAMQEILLSGGDAAEILKRYQDEFNARVAEEG